MAYTAPVTWANNTVPDAADLNEQIRDNLNYIHSGRQLFQVYGAIGAGNLTTTSTTYVAVTGYSATFTPQLPSGRILLLVSFNLGATGGTSSLAVYLNGVIHKELWNNNSVNGSIPTNRCFVVCQFQSLTINTPNTIALYFLNNGGTATLYRTNEAMVMTGIEF